MTILEAIAARHSVRAYLDKKIDPSLMVKINQQINQLNTVSGLNFQVLFDQPKPFENMVARYGGFTNVHSFIALVGKESDRLDHLCGYYGQMMVLYLQGLGLNSCWVALTYSKKKTGIRIEKGQRLVAVITFGYGKTQGKPHNSKSKEKVTLMHSVAQPWFYNGVDAALLAPTALNQQEFELHLLNDTVDLVKKSGFYADIDMGIIQLHFELGAGSESFEWKDGWMENLKRHIKQQSHQLHWCDQ